MNGKIINIEKKIECIKSKIDKDKNGKDNAKKKNQEEEKWKKDKDKNKKDKDKNGKIGKDRSKTDKDKSKKDIGKKMKGKDKNGKIGKDNNKIIIINKALKDMDLEISKGLTLQIMDTKINQDIKDIDKDPMDHMEPLILMVLLDHIVVIVAIIINKNKYY